MKTLSKIFGFTFSILVILYLIIWFFSSKWLFNQIENKSFTEIENILVCEKTEKNWNPTSIGVSLVGCKDKTNFEYNNPINISYNIFNSQILIKTDIETKVSSSQNEEANLSGTLLFATSYNLMQDVIENIFRLNSIFGQKRNFVDLLVALKGGSIAKVLSSFEDFKIEFSDVKLSSEGKTLFSKGNMKNVVSIKDFKEEYSNWEELYQFPPKFVSIKYTTNVQDYNYASLDFAPLEFNILSLLYDVFWGAVTNIALKYERPEYEIESLTKEIESSRLSIDVSAHGTSNKENYIKLNVAHNIPNTNEKTNFAYNINYLIDNDFFKIMDFVLKRFEKVYTEIDSKIMNLEKTLVPKPVSLSDIHKFFSRLTPMEEAKRLSIDLQFKTPLTPQDVKLDIQNASIIFDNAGISFSSKFLPMKLEGQIAMLNYRKFVQDTMTFGRKLAETIDNSSVRNSINALLNPVFTKLYEDFLRDISDYPDSKNLNDLTISLHLDANDSKATKIGTMSLETVLEHIKNISEALQPKNDKQDTEKPLQTPTEASTQTTQETVEPQATMPIKTPSE